MGSSKCANAAKIADAVQIINSTFLFASDIIHSSWRLIIDVFSAATISQTHTGAHQIKRHIFNIMCQCGLKKS